MKRTKKEISKQYLHGQYKGYSIEYGNPEGAAAMVLESLRQVEDLIAKIKIQTDVAGEFLSPGMRRTTKQDLMNIINQL